MLQPGAFTDQTISQINAMFSAVGSNIITGNKYYLDPANVFGGSSDGNSGLSAQTAFLSLNAAYNALRSGYNDGIVLLGTGNTNSTARLGAAFTWAKNAAHMIGACSPVMYGQRARIANTTAATAFKALFTVSGIGCMFANLEFFQGFTAGTTAEIGLTVTGARNAFLNCQIIGMADTDAAGAQDAGSRHIKITSAENYFGHCVIGEDTITRINANASVEFTGAFNPRNVFEDCIFPAYVGAGGAPVFIHASASSIDREEIFRNCLFLNAIGSGATAMTAAVTVGAASGGLIVLDKCTFVGATALADSAGKSQTYLTGPATSGASGIGVVVT